MDVFSATTLQDKKKYFYVKIKSSTIYETDDESYIANYLMIPLSDYYKNAFDYGGINLNGRSTAYVFFSSQKKINKFIKEYLIPTHIANKLIAR